MLWLLACFSQPPDIVLVSLDTTRADALSAWGGPAATPTLERLSAQGVRFEWALSHAPTTLSSHATVWTGLDPHGHQVVRNGHPLNAALDTLPKRLSAAGYDTLGVIGASPLGSTMGVSAGFRLWMEAFSVDRGRRQEARAEEVTDHALKLLKKRKKKKPLFLFVHYYDAHGPYDAPAPWTSPLGDPAYAGPVDGSSAAAGRVIQAIRAGQADPADVQALSARYYGELSYVDHELGRLLAGLNDPIVVIFGDHGEMLGEDPDRPFGHGMDVDLTEIHVPLLIAGPGLPTNVTVSQPVGLQHLATTVLGLAGVPGALGQGVDLAPLWRGQPLNLPPHFAEATQPADYERKDTWPNLDFERAVAADGHLLITAPLFQQPPALYAIAPGQPRVEDTTRAAQLTALLSAWDRAAPAYQSVEMSAETREGLKVLGYIE